MTTHTEPTPTMTKNTPPISDRQRPLQILVLCTGNSARSIMAEALFNTLGAPLFQAKSAGSKPTGRVHPLALEQIQALPDPAEGYLSKSWREFTRPDSTAFDIILTVCDNAARDDCPLFNSGAEHIHWGLPDPAAIDGDQAVARRAFATCFDTLKTRIESLVLSQASDADLPDTIGAMRQFQ